jgi:hypothetical protein
MTVIPFIIALLALIVAVVAMLLQLTSIWDGGAISLLALSVLALSAPTAIAGRIA